jgi:hypothetical protein
MITCDAFRTQFAPGSDDAAVLEHLRSCDACLNFAVERDGDVLFRAIGGSDLVPPGGVDAFVDDVMRAVHIRSAESTMSSRGVTWPRKLALAASVAMAIAGSALMYERSHEPIILPAGPALVAHHVRKAITPKPIIESYDSQKATIVEMPTDREDVKVVMVLDDTLPADL